MRAVRLTQQRVRERSSVVHEKGETHPRGLPATAIGGDREIYFDIFAERSTLHPLAPYELKSAI